MRLSLGACVVTGGALVAGGLLAAPGAALAAWSVASEGGSVTARAAQLPAVQRPEVRAGRAGSTVVVDWPAVDGVPGEEYRVVRLDAVTGERAEVSGSCRRLISGTRCTDAGVPDGRWTYRVRAVLGDWTGSWSPPSDPVLIDTAPVEPERPPVARPSGPAKPTKPEEPKKTPQGAPAQPPTDAPAQPKPPTQTKPPAQPAPSVEPEPPAEPEAAPTTEPAPAPDPTASEEPETAAGRP